MDAWENLSGSSGDAWERMYGSSGDAWERLPGTSGDAWERLIDEGPPPYGQKRMSRMGAMAAVGGGRRTRRRG